MILFTLYLFLDDYLRNYSLHSINVCSTKWAFLALMRNINSHFPYLLLVTRELTALAKIPQLDKC